MHSQTPIFFLCSLSMSLSMPFETIRFIALNALCSAARQHRIALHCIVCCHALHCDSRMKVGNATTNTSTSSTTTPAVSVSSLRSRTSSSTHSHSDSAQLQSDHHDDAATTHRHHRPSTIVPHHRTVRVSHHRAAGQPRDTITVAHQYWSGP